LTPGIIPGDYCQGPDLTAPTFFVNGIPYENHAYRQFRSALHAVFGNHEDLAHLTPEVVLVIRGLQDRNSKTRDHLQRLSPALQHLGARVSIPKPDRGPNLAIVHGGDGPERRARTSQTETPDDQLVYPFIFWDGSGRDRVESNGNPRNARTLMRKAAISLIRQPRHDFLQSTYEE
jgi:hypothetical protein